MGFEQYHKANKKNVSCNGNLLFAIWILPWYILNIVVFFLFGGLHPVICIRGFNSTIHDCNYVLRLILLSVVINFFIAVILELQESTQD